MKELTRQLFTNLAPAIACLTIYACAQIVPPHGAANPNQAVLLLPKISSLDTARISMLATQKERYGSALRDYQTAMSKATNGIQPVECVTLRNTVACASNEYGFVAQETADSAFRASGLPRALPKP